MSGVLKATTFSAIFLTLYAFMNFYVFEHISGVIGAHKGMLYHFLLVFSIFMYFPAVIVEAVFDRWWSKLLYILVALNMGMVLIYSALFFFIDIIWIFGIDLWVHGTWILLFGVAIGIYGIINASIIRIHRFELYSDLRKITRNYRIVQVSDVHLGPVRSYKFLEKIVYKINKLNPDVVLITGDLLDWRYKYQKSGLKILKNIKAPTYFSIGNHEIYAGIGYVESLLDGTGLKILRNSSCTYKELQIIGIDDAEDKMQLRKQLFKISLDAKKYHILMYHRPDNYKDAKGIDLMLSGHTHAGQIFPFNYAAWFFTHPVRGIHRHLGTTLYVSHGVGTWGPPIRTGCRSEIVCIELKNKAI